MSSIKWTKCWTQTVSCRWRWTGCLCSSQRNSSWNQHGEGSRADSWRTVGRTSHKLNRCSIVSLCPWSMFHEPRDLTPELARRYGEAPPGWSKITRLRTPAPSDSRASRSRPFRECGFDFHLRHHVGFSLRWTRRMERNPTSKSVCCRRLCNDGVPPRDGTRRNPVRVRGNHSCPLRAHREDAYPGQGGPPPSSNRHRRDPAALARRAESR